MERRVFPEKAEFCLVVVGRSFKLSLGGEG